MGTNKKNILLTVLIIFSSLVCAFPARAVPVLPSSFYGTVLVNDVVVPDGTVVQALIDDQVIADGLTQTYEGQSVFALDVAGDDLETPADEGGTEGDIVFFEVGGILAEQTGIWHSGTNARIDLAVYTTEPIDAPISSPSPLPTQTAIIQSTSPPASNQTTQPTNTTEPTGTPEEVSNLLPTETTVLVQENSPEGQAVEITKEDQVNPIIINPTDLNSIIDDGAADFYTIQLILIILGGIVLLGGLIWITILFLRSTQG